MQAANAFVTPNQPSKRGERRLTTRRLAGAGRRKEAAWAAGQRSTPTRAQAALTVALLRQAKQVLQREAPPVGHGHDCHAAPGHARLDLLQHLDDVRPQHQRVLGQHARVRGDPHDHIVAFGVEQVGVLLKNARLRAPEPEEQHQRCLGGRVAPSLGHEHVVGRAHAGGRERRSSSAGHALRPGPTALGSASCHGTGGGLSQAPTSTPALQPAARPPLPVAAVGRRLSPPQHGNCHAALNPVWRLRWWVSAVRCLLEAQSALHEAREVPALACSARTQHQAPSSTFIAHVAVRKGQAKIADQERPSALPDSFEEQRAKAQAKAAGRPTAPAQARRRNRICPKCNY